MTLPPDSHIRFADIEEGDIILAANHMQTPTVESLQRAAAKRDDILLLQVVRDKSKFFVAVKPKSLS